MSKRTTNWRLPPDIEFIIINYVLDADKATLASCSLVCSRWLPPSRKHLFKDVVIKRANHLPDSDPVMDFLHVIEHSGDIDPQWAIGSYVKQFELVDGGFLSWAFDTEAPIVTCPLSVLRALLSKLPRLVSLYLERHLIVDDASLDPNGKQCQRFELDKLAISGCSGPEEDPHHLLALICMFSTIGSLSVDQWGRWRYEPLATFSPAAFSTPAVRSLVVKLVEDNIAVRALYDLLASSSAITNTCLASLSVHTFESEDIGIFFAFVNHVGAALRDINLRVEANVPLELLHDTVLTTCTMLSSLTLSIECTFEDFGTDGDDTRTMFRAYMDILQTHRAVFTSLTTVRLEMRPVGPEIVDAFMRIAQDTYYVWPEKQIQTVDPHEAEQNREVWASLDDVLCGFPALERVEFVLYEPSWPEPLLSETEKVDLRNALERRLPELRPNGVAQLTFEQLD